MKQRNETNVSEMLRTLVRSEAFNNLILGVILINSLLIGVETFYHPAWLELVQITCLYVFVSEIIVRFIARESAREFFTNGWNIFDIIVIGSVFVPSVSGFCTILRILRIFRVLRMIRIMPQLRVIVEVLARSVCSMGYITLLLGLLFYVYAVVGINLFGQHFEEYATLKEAFFTLFRALTMEDWTDLRYDLAKIFGYWLPTIYYVSWVVLSAFLMTNLIVGAIIANYDIVLNKEKKDDENKTSFSFPLSDKQLKKLIDDLNSSSAKDKVTINLFVINGNKEIKQENKNDNDKTDDSDAA